MVSRSFLRLVILCLVSAGLSTSTFALDAQLAKRCRDLAIKAHPPVVAGMRTGTAQAERDYYRKCIDRGGNVDTENANKPRN